MERRKRKAISAVLGTAIALVIVFTVFIPLIMYLQSLQTIFMQEASRRLQYELERIHEKLEVHISITPAGTVYPNHYIYVIIYNPGVLTVDIPTIYIESKNKGIMEVPEKFSIPPGGVQRYRLEKFYIGRGEDDVVRIKVVTLRGNNFISRETIGPKDLPYHLIITVSNMTFGRQYEIGVRSIKEYGCVLLAMRQELGCSEEEYAVIEPQSFNDTNGLAIFKVAPGEYSVWLKDLSDNSPIASTTIEVLNDVVLNLPIPEIEWPKQAPLRVDAIHKNMTLVANEEGNALAVIPYIISLGATPEPLSAAIEIQYRNEIGNIICAIDQGELSTINLNPGNMFLGNFTLHCSLGGGPGIIRYNVSVTNAVGILSHKTYEKQQLVKGGDEGVIKICVVKRMTLLAPGEENTGPKEVEVRFIECP